jgi:transposase
MLVLAAAVSTLTDFDQLIFAAVVPQDHYLRQVCAVIDFERFRANLEKGYSATLGRPSIDAIRMLKLAFLGYHYRLSDRRVIARCATDVAFRCFLGLSTTDSLPHPSEASYFRKRHGERLSQTFQELLGIARQHGLISDRLRLKDATHIFADAAQVKPFQLAAQVRERLLHAAQPCWPDWVTQQRQRLQTLRQSTAELPDDERLPGRIEFVRDLTEQLQQRLVGLPEATLASGPYQRLQRAVAIAAKLLADHAQPQAGGPLASAADGEARLGKHGGFFLGYVLDLAMDADSELITAVNVLPGNAAGNGLEAADAAQLIAQEETAQGNDVAALSMDGAGYNGPVLRHLTDPEGLNLEVTVPVPQPPPRQTFGPERFALTVLADGTAELTCPTGATTRQRERNEDDTGWKYGFKASQCGKCPLRSDCLSNPKSTRGRKVTKNDYEADYRQARQKVGTPEYQEVRSQHTKVERKLGEVARHHGQRRARYRGQARVLVQAVLTALVVNVKRLVKLVGVKVWGAVGAGTVRAQPCSG